jgi:hypothetical protein
VVVLALRVGLIGCGGERVPEYNLTISSRGGVSVTAPGEVAHGGGYPADCPGALAFGLGADPVSRQGVGQFSCNCLPVLTG